MKCPYCQSEVPDTAKKCAHCGEWIKENPKSKTVYLILSFLFGNFGLAEFYRGSAVGILYLALSALSPFFNEYIPYPITICVVWIFQFVCAIGIGINQKQFRSSH